MSTNEQISRVLRSDSLILKQQLFEPVQLNQTLESEVQTAAESTSLQVQMVCVVSVHTLHRPMVPEGSVLSVKIEGDFVPTFRSHR